MSPGNLTVPPDTTLASDVPSLKVTEPTVADDVVPARPVSVETKDKVIAVTTTGVPRSIANVKRGEEIVKAVAITSMLPLPVPAGVRMLDAIDAILEVVVVVDL